MTSTFGTFVDRCMFLASSGGTGTFTVAGAATGFMTPAQAGAATATQYSYAAQLTDASGNITAWETGTGTYTVSGTTLTRSPTFSSNSNAVVNFTSAPNVMLTPLTKDLYSTITTVNAKTFGAVGDGVTDDTAALQAAINAAFVVTTSNAVGPPVGNKILYIPPGNYKTTSPLLLTGTFGVVMTGAGRFTTQIINSAGTNVITTQGCQYSMFKDMLLQTSGSGICFDLDWDGVNNCALQSNTFQNMFFSGGAYGVAIGFGGFMGSENDFINCFFLSNTTAGISPANFNAACNQVYGGDFQGCGTGILVQSGSVPSIVGVSFQTSVNWDISVTGSANDCYQVAGCRSESVNFANFVRGNANVSGCNHVGIGNGTFVSSTFHAVGIYNCISTLGQVHLEDGAVDYCEFGRSDWAASGHTSSVRGTWVGGTIDSTGYITYLSDGLWANGSFTNSTVFGGLAILTDAATIATDAGKGPTFVVTITGNRVLGNPTNANFGATYYWFIVQGAGGSHTLSYDTMFRWPGGVVPTLSTAAGAIDLITAIYTGDLFASIQKAYA